MTTVGADTLEATIACVAAGLLSVRHEALGSFITTPMMYPSGGGVVIWIDRNPPYFLMSDYSFAARECEIMGADKRQFVKRASPIAEMAGVDLASDSAFDCLGSDLARRPCLSIRLRVLASSDTTMNPPRTLAQAIAQNRIADFAAQAEAQGIGPASASQFEALMGRVTAPLREDLTSRSRAGGGLRGR